MPETDLRVVQSAPIPADVPGPSTPRQHAQTAHAQPLVAASNQPASAYRTQYANAGQHRYQEVAHAIEQDIREQYQQAEGQSAEQIAALLATLVLQSTITQGINPTQTDGDLQPWIKSAIRPAYAAGIQAARDQLSYDFGEFALDDRLSLLSHSSTYSQTRIRQQRLWSQVADDIQSEVTATVRKHAERDTDAQTIAARVSDRVETVGQYRADLIGSTEPARAFLDAQLTEWQALGFTEVSVDWKTQQDRHVCESCRAGAANSPYPIEQAKGLIPHHPRCRCFYSVNEDSKERQPR